MGRYAKDSGDGEFQQAPAGNHVARCIRLIDLGTQHGEYQGKAIVNQKIFISWELPEELMEDGAPFVVSAFLTNSLNEKANLRAMLESWRNKAFTEEELKGFDLNNVLGKPCLLSVIHNDKGRARVSTAASLPKGMKCPNGVNEQFAYWIEEHDEAVYQTLSKGLRSIIEQSDEWKALQRRQEPLKTPMQKIEALDDDVPF